MNRKNVFVQINVNKRQWRDIINVKEVNIKINYMEEYV
jgi:hypothetical protein